MGEEEGDTGVKSPAEQNIHSLLASMKDIGILSACIRSDGVVVASTIALDSTGAGMIASIANVTDALMKENEDKQKEIEVIVDTLYLVIIPLHNHILCGILKDREEKKKLREYAGRIAELL